MTSTDIGKNAKRKGAVHPRNARKEPLPDRPTPLAKPRRKVAKPFGMKYDSKTDWQFDPVPGKRYYALRFEWETRTEWFATARSRDQAMSAWRKKHGRDPENYRSLQAVSAG